MLLKQWTLNAKQQPMGKELKEGRSYESALAKVRIKLSFISASMDDINDFSETLKNGTQAKQSRDQQPPPL